MTKRVVQRKNGSSSEGRAFNASGATAEKAKQARSRYTVRLGEIVTGFGRYAEDQRKTRAKIVDPAMRQRLAD